MKNHEEFRRTVMEKAEQYEAEKKRRNRRIRDSVLLCSLCLAISLTAYFSLRNIDLFGLIKEGTNETADCATLSNSTENVTGNEMTTDGSPSLNTTETPAETMPSYNETTSSMPMQTEGTTMAPESSTVMTTDGPVLTQPSSTRPGTDDGIVLAARFTGPDGPETVQQFGTAAEMEQYFMRYGLSTRELSRYGENYFSRSDVLLVRFDWAGVCELSATYETGGVLFLEFTEKAPFDGNTYYYLLSAPKKKYADIRLTVIPFS